MCLQCIHSFRLRGRRKLANQHDLGDEGTQTIEAESRSFRMHFLEWRAEQTEQMPQLALPKEIITLDADDEHDNGEEILGLPSEMSATDVVRFDLTLAASHELKIRIGLAFDLLEEVRQAVRHCSAFLQSKKKNARGTKDQTRAATELRKQQRFANRIAQQYNHNFDRISSLRTTLAQPADPNEIASKLKKIILRTDLKIAALSVPRTRGDSKKSGSWIWGIVDTPMVPRNTRKRKREQVEEEAEADNSGIGTEWKTDGEWVPSVITHTHAYGIYMISGM